MKRQYVEKLKLPDEPGIYIFRDYKKRPLYIGRATSLKDRVKSYFSIDLIDTRGPRIVDMVTKAVSLTHEKADSVLEAILRESELIKKYQPFYNVDERDDKSDQYVVITDEAWPRVFLVRARDFDHSRKVSEGNSKDMGAGIVPEALPYKVKRVFGPYPAGGLIKEALKILRKLFPFKDKKAYDPRHDNFYRALGRSPQARNPEEESNARRRYARTIGHLILFFEGKKDALRKKVEKEMHAQAKKMRFEEATQSRKLLYALDHINDIALIKEQNSFERFGERTAENGERRTRRDFRIEAYDIAHLSGTNVVGSMTVNVNGEAVPSEYRKFKVSTEANNDAAGLGEILFRRLNHTEWTYPDLIVVDGNEAQRSLAERILSARRITIPVVAVTKDDRHKASKLVGDPQLTSRFEKQIVAVNAEAHRFAISYHRLRRSRL